MGSELDNMERPHRGPDRGDAGQLAVLYPAVSLVEVSLLRHGRRFTGTKKAWSKRARRLAACTDVTARGTALLLPRH